MNLRLLPPLLACASSVALADSILTFDNLNPGYTVPSWYGPALRGDWAWTDTASNPWWVLSGSGVSGNYVVNGVGPHYNSTKEWWVGMGVAGGHGPYYDVSGAYFAGIDSENVKIEALRDGVVVKTLTLSLTLNDFQWYDLALTKVNYLRLTSDAPDKHWGMDDLHYSLHVPDGGAGSAALLLISFIGLYCYSRTSSK